MQRFKLLYLLVFIAQTVNCGPFKKSAEFAIRAAGYSNLEQLASNWIVPVIARQSALYKKLFGSADVEEIANKHIEVVAQADKHAQYNIASIRDYKPTAETGAFVRGMLLMNGVCLRDVLVISKPHWHKNKDVISLSGVAANYLMVDPVAFESALVEGNIDERMFVELVTLSVVDRIKEYDGMTTALAKRLEISSNDKKELCELQDLRSSMNGVLTSSNPVAMAQFILEKKLDTRNDSEFRQFCESVAGLDNKKK